MDPEHVYCACGYEIIRKLHIFIETMFFNKEGSRILHCPGCGMYFDKGEYLTKEPPEKIRYSSDLGKVHPWLTIEFWHETFESRGFERTTCYDGGRFHFAWYTTGKFQVGYDASDIHDCKLPLFIFIYKQSGIDRDIKVEKQFEFNEAENFLLFLDAMVDPGLMPLCIRLSWAQDIVSAFLKELNTD